MQTAKHVVFVASSRDKNIWIRVRTDGKDGSICETQLFMKFASRLKKPYPNIKPSDLALAYYFAETWPLILGFLTVAGYSRDQITVWRAEVMADIL